jgi:glycine/D-amino acid oxidase-like deaminating enzyme
VLSLWAKYQSLAKMCGEAEALRLCQQSSQAIVELEAFCQQHDIDAQLRLDGWLWAATTTAQLAPGTVRSAGWNAGPASLPTAGRRSGRAAEWFQPASGRGIRAGIGVGSAGHAGAWSVAPRPAAGVKVYESSPMERLEGGTPARVQCTHGSVRADKVILAMNAWAAQFADIRKAFVVVSSDVVMTRPCLTC